MMDPVTQLKMASIAAVRQAGGKEGAGATAERSSSTAGGWRDRNCPALPPLDCAHRLDQAAIIEGKRPELLHAYASGLGFVAIRLPEACDGEDARASALIDAMAEVGDIPNTYRERAADGRFDEKDANALDREIDEAIEKLVELKQVNRAMFVGAGEVIRIREGK